MTPKKKTYVELFPSIRQKQWEWPAIANFSLGGAGAGFHCFIFLTTYLGNDAYINLNAFLLKLLGPTIVTIGLMLLLIEAGRPSRTFHLIRRLRLSWMSREVLFYLIFLLTALVDYVSPSVALRLVSVTCAVGLILSQGFIVHDSKAVSAWNRPAVPWLFLLSGIASGAVIALLISLISAIPSSPEFLLIAILSIAANSVIWTVYLFYSGHGDEDFRSATQALRRPVSLAAILGLGHFLPLGLILILYSVNNRKVGGHYSTFLAIVSGVLILAGVFLQKAALIHQAGGKRRIGFDF